MVLIVGGGITGLAAAFELTARGVPFRLIEASPRTGGLIHTERIDGFTIDAGPDSILAQKPAALELCDALGLGPRLISSTPPRHAYVLRDGQLHALPTPSVLGIPTTPAGILAYDLLPWHARVRLALEPLVPRRTAPGEESVGAFFRRRFGGATVDLVASPLLGGIHAGDIERLSMASLFPRFVEAEAARGSILRAFGRTHARPAPAGLFRSLAGGMGELVEAIEHRLPGGAVLRGAPAVQLIPTRSGWCVTTPQQALTARAVILAIPAPAAARLLAPVDERIASLAGGVPYVSTVSVALAYPRASVRHPLAGSGFVVARRHNPLRITACTWVSSKWAGRAPAGSVLLRVFLGGAHDPEAVDLDDRALVRIAVADITGVLGIDGPPQIAHVTRWRDAGAQHHVGQLARMREIESALAAHPGLLVAGSGFRAVGIPDCVADGRAAGAAAAEYSKSAPQERHGSPPGR